jgi:predicted transcriptional regulator
VISVRLDPEVAAWLDGLARERGVTSGVYLQAVLSQNFKRRSDGPAVRMRTPADRREVTTRFKEKK